MRTVAVGDDLHAGSRRAAGGRVFGMDALRLSRVVQEERRRGVGLEQETGAEQNEGDAAEERRVGEQVTAAKSGGERRRHCPVSALVGGERRGNLVELGRVAQMCMWRVN